MPKICVMRVLSPITRKTLLGRETSKRGSLIAAGAWVKRTSRIQRWIKIWFLGEKNQQAWKEHHNVPEGALE